MILAKRQSIIQIDGNVEIRLLRFVIGRHKMRKMAKQGVLNRIVTPQSKRLPFIFEQELQPDSFVLASRSRASNDNLKRPPWLQKMDLNYDAGSRAGSCLL
jgi:hypothetical protein